MSDPRTRLLAVLHGEVGYQMPAGGETKYGDWFAAKVGDPAYKKGDFCAMGQLYSADKAGLLELFGGARKEWAWVPSWLKHFQSQGWQVDGPGELVLGFMDWEPNGVPNHVLMATGPARGGMFPTIEFNTRKGGTGPVGCWERTRPVSQALAFIKLPIPAATDDDTALVVSLGA
jgi:hypothetical protein